MGVRSHLSGAEAGAAGILVDPGRGTRESGSGTESGRPGGRSETSKSWACLVFVLLMFFVRIQQQTMTERNRRAHTMIAVAPVAKHAHCILMRENPPED